MSANVKPKKPTIGSEILSLLHSGDLTYLEILNRLDSKSSSIAGAISRLLRNEKIEFYEFQGPDLNKKPKRKYKIPLVTNYQVCDIEKPIQENAQKLATIEVSKTALFWARALIGTEKVNKNLVSEV